MYKIKCSVNCILFLLLMIEFKGRCCNMLDTLAIVGIKA